jgi:hypothetical protein
VGRRDVLARPAGDAALGLGLADDRGGRGPLARRHPTRGGGVPAAPVAAAR